MIQVERSMHEQNTADGLMPRLWCWLGGGKKDLEGKVLLDGTGQDFGKERTLAGSWRRSLYVGRGKRRLCRWEKEGRQAPPKNHSRQL